MNRNQRPKPRLIIGRQGTGKTLRFYKILADCYPKKIVIKSLISVKFANKAVLEKEYDILGVDEIATINDLFYLAKVSLTSTIKVVVAAQLVKDEIPKDLLSLFEVIDMDEETEILKPATDENNN